MTADRFVTVLQQVFQLQLRFLIAFRCRLRLLSRQSLSRQLKIGTALGDLLLQAAQLPDCLGEIPARSVVRYLRRYASFLRPVLAQEGRPLPRCTLSCGFGSLAVQRRHACPQPTDGLSGLQVLRPPSGGLGRRSLGGLPEPRLVILLFGLKCPQMRPQLIQLSVDPFPVFVGGFLLRRRNGGDPIAQFGWPICHANGGRQKVRKKCQILSGRELTDQVLQSFTGIPMIGSRLRVQRHQLQRTRCAGSVVAPATHLQRLIVDLDGHRAADRAQRF